eukprot:scaffold4876_cov177-Amphora_coffeaeformis.AAC.2
MSHQQHLCKVAQKTAFSNNEAVLLMERGDYVTASTILRNTIDILQENHDCMASYSPEDGFLFELEVSADSLCGLSKLLPTTKAAREDASIGMFDRAFYLNHVDLAHNGSSFGIRQFALIVLVFNLGICMHVRAFVAHSRQDEFFGKAVTLYQMACGLFECTADERMVTLLLLALTNNLSSIHAHFCDMVETQRWLDEVRFTYVINAANLKKDEVALFSTNLLANDQLHARSSPAA